MNVDFSLNQNNVINLIKGDLLVAASAGSGKTSVLVERILNLILNHNVSIDEILIITFTNLAANEMSDRILKSLEKSITPHNRSLIEEQIFLISNANIQTFHSFCLEILKNNYYKLNLNMDFKILKDSHREALIAELIEEVFLFYYDEQIPEFIDLVNKYGGKYSDDKLRNMVISIYNFVQTKPNIEKFMDKILEYYKFEKEDEILNTIWGKNLKEDYLFKFRKFKMYVLEFNREYDLCFSDNEKEIILSDLSIIDGLIKNIEFGYTNFKGYVKNIQLSRFPSKCVEEFKEYKLLRGEIRKLIEELKDDIFYKSEEEVKSYMEKLYVDIEILFKVVNKFRERLIEEKINRGVIDFNDMEHLALLVLENMDVCESFKAKFKYIFIDEYQDTSYLQEELINRIKRNNPFNVFMVGDVKQSIYSFRDSKVDLFYKKYRKFNTLVSLESASDINNKILLYDNYRSRKEIIDFINSLFENIMVKDISNIEYTKQENLSYKGNYKEDLNSFGEVRIGIVTNNENLENPDYGECNLIVKYIKNLIDREKQNRIFDKELKLYRNIEYRDIVILMRNIRSSSKSKLLEEVFVKNNILIHVDNEENFFDSIEVIVIMSLLNVINNPLDDVDLLCVLRSEIFSFSENELVYLRIVNKQEYLYNNLKQICSMEENKNEEVYLSNDFSLSYDEFLEFKDKCQKFLDKTNTYRDNSNMMRIDDFIWYLYMDTNYYFSVSTMNDGLKRQNNLKIIFNKAKEFRISNFSGLFNFIHYFNSLRKVGEKDISSKIISDDENVVKVMSIHKSKGLEFPVVILCNTSDKFNIRNVNSSIIFHDDLGIGINYIDYEKNLEIESLVKKSIKLKVYRDTISEELRILYVALTRAREKLFITGSSSIEKFSKKINNLSKCKSYLDFICSVFLKEGINFDEDKEIMISDKTFIDIVNSKEFFNKEEDIYNLEQDRNCIEEILQGDIEIDEISDILNFKYKFNEQVNIPLNISVSNVLSYDSPKYENINFKIPKFLNRNDESLYSGAEIGSLYHLVMQNINLCMEINEDYINLELNRMLNLNIFDKEDLKYINASKILGFFKTDLGNRLLKCFNINGKIYREFEFLMNHKIEKISNESVRIQGIVDLFFIEDDEIVVLDYKTDKMLLKNFKSTSRYKEQLNLYSIALEKIFNKRVKEKYIYSFYLSEIVKV